MLGILIRVSLEWLSVLITNCRGSCQHLFETSRYKMWYRAQCTWTLTTVNLAFPDLALRPWHFISDRVAQILRDSGALAAQAFLSVPCRSYDMVRGHLSHDSNLWWHRFPILLCLQVPRVTWLIWRTESQVSCTQHLSVQTLSRRGNRFEYHDIIIQYMQNKNSRHRQY